MILRNLLTVLCICVIFTLSAQTTGPENGSLVIVGGGGATDPILEKFIELAGGPENHLVVIPTAAGRDSYDQNAGIADRLRGLGAENVVVWHTNDREQADDASFTQPLAEAEGIWFGGGRQWRLVDAYAGTRAEEIFNELLEMGGVIGGSSAGASIQGSYLVRGDTDNNQVMMGDHEVGFGFIKNIAIDQHVLARNRHFDLFEILDAKPGLLGVGIDEKTAMIVQGDVFEVMGPSYVLVYDDQFWSREGSDLKKLPKANRLFYFLREGDRYDMRKREKQ
jgi:cyanophycinase